MSDSSSVFNPQESNYRWVITALALTSFTVTFVCRFAWPPLVPEIMPLMKISRTEAMAFMTAFYIGYVAAQIPSGLLTDRFGPRRILFSAIALQGLGTLSLGFTENYQAGFFWRILCGLGAGCVFSSCLKAIVTWFTPAQRGLAIGALYLSLPLGIAIPNFIMPLLSEALGWQGAFRALGLGILGLAFFLLGLMKEIKAPANAPRPKILGGLKIVFRNRNIILASLSGFSCVWVYIGFSSVFNAYLVSTLGFTVPEAGRIMMLYALIGFFMPPLAGYLSLKIPKGKKATLIGGHLFLTAVLLAFGWIGGGKPALVMGCLIVLMSYFFNPVYTVIIADNAAPEWAATAGGVSNTILQTAALFSPLIIGLAADLRGNYGLTWVILAAGALLGAISMAFTTQPGSKP